MRTLNILEAVKLGGCSRIEVKLNTGCDGLQFCSDGCETCLSLAQGFGQEELLDALLGLLRRRYDCGKLLRGGSKLDGEGARHLVLCAELLKLGYGFCVGLEG